MIVGRTWAREQVDDAPDVGCVKPVIGVDLQQRRELSQVHDRDRRIVGVEHGVRMGKDHDRDE
jgi:hypothetical protein